MNLRTLKKLSKRAAPLLPLLGDTREQFPARRWENYTGVVILDRKHWERGRSAHGDSCREREVKHPAKSGDGWIYAHPPDHPRKGTIMVGAMEGYYEPEWSEETAWEALEAHVATELTDWSAEQPVWPDGLDTPSDVFRRAAELIARRGAQP